jgi:S-DNA-T family DNA segregation ATPase FtsK/SpoIIIE
VLKENARILEQKLQDFGVTGKVVEIHPGPVITMYEFKPAAGIKISRIANLSDDLTMALAAMRIRIVAPIPGKDVVGIEVPNKAREIVYMKEIFSDQSFQRAKSKLVLALGKDIVGNSKTFDLAKAPHLLVAGSTGSGKSVAINSFICSILYKARPDEVRMIMVDPKMLELSVYDAIPHLLLPVVTDPKKAALALKWAVAEMERRYKLMAGTGVRNILGYNTKIEKLQELKEQEEAALAARARESIVMDEEDPDDEPLPEVEDEPLEKLPYIVVIIDELADLMMVASKDVETAIARLAQMARAAGIHMILATQRPSVDVITGLIKANFPTRISFQVASKIDSRTILDRQGAENLLGQGDMLFLPPGTSKLERCHGAYVGEDEIARITTHIKAQAKPQYCMEILVDEDGEASVAEEDKEYDEFYDQAVAIVAETRQASISYLQRRLKIGYNRAARIVECMEREGVVGAQNGPGPREVFIDPI